MFDKYKQIFYPYVINGRTQYILVKDITTNIRYMKDAVVNGAVYNLIDLDDGDTPERVAEQFYDNPELCHTVMLTNETYDIKEDFPLSQDTLEAMIDEKYANPFGIHHYEDVYGNIIPENNVEMRYFTLDIECVDAEKYELGITEKLLRTIKHKHYFGDSYEYNAPEIFNSYPDVDVIRGKMGEFNKHALIKYHQRCIAFTLADDSVLVDTGDEDNRFQRMPANGMVNANIFEKTFKGTVPAGMLSVWIKPKGEVKFTKSDMAWNNITANPGDSIEIRTKTDWMPLPCFATYSFSSIDRRFPILYSDNGVRATDISGMFYPVDENGKMLGNPLRRVPSRLFDANTQVRNASHLFGACLDIEYDDMTGVAGIPRDILASFPNLEQADHFAHCVNVPLVLYVCSTRLDKMEYDLDSDADIGEMDDSGNVVSYKDIHTEAWKSGEYYGSVEAFFNEIPWNRKITNQVYIQKQPGSEKTYAAFSQQRTHLMQVRQEKFAQYSGFASLVIYTVPDFPEFRIIRDAVAYAEDEIDTDEINYKAMHIIPITNREYEIRLNDAKRRIAIIRPDMIDDAQNSIESALED